VQDYLAGKLDRKAARWLGGQAWTHADNVSYRAWKAGDRDRGRVALVCSAAVRAQDLATGNDKPVPIQLDSSLSDDMLDPYSWDTSYYVCRYVAGRVGWPDDDVERRRQFWGWYIHEAAPMAWQSESGDE
jgi:hypothetical protein